MLDEKLKKKRENPYVKDFQDATARWQDLQKRWQFLKSEGESLLTFFDKVLRFGNRKGSQQRRLLNSYHKLISAIEGDYLLSHLNRYSLDIYGQDYVMPKEVLEALKVLKSFYAQIYRDAQDRNIQLKGLLNLLDRDLAYVKDGLHSLNDLHLIAENLLKISKDTLLDDLEDFRNQEGND
jgi:hypothetical protein